MKVKEFIEILQSLVGDVEIEIEASEDFSRDRGEVLSIDTICYCKGLSKSGTTTEERVIISVS